MKAKYELQLLNAKETLSMLENKLHDLRAHLKNNPHDTEKYQEFREVTLDMTITLNEIEDLQEHVDIK
jgi:hypothetical protein